MNTLGNLDSGKFLQIPAEPSKDVSVILPPEMETSKERKGSEPVTRSPNFPPCQFRSTSGVCDLITHQCGYEVAPTLDACQVCSDTATPETGSFNRVTTSLSFGKIRKERPEDLQAAKTAWGHLLQRTQPEPFLGGPGTILKALLGTIGFRPCETCRGYATKMDREGPDWCTDNEETILDWLQKNAKKRGVPFIRSVGRVVLRRAIKQSRKTIMGNLKDSFEEVYCVTLDRRPDRWDQFMERVQSAGWPFQEIQKFQAVDGKLCKPPAYWTQGGGAWGCYRSHLRILEDCLNRGVKSVLFLEDDALPCEDFPAKAEKFLRHLPEDWGMIYLGGQHLLINKFPPIMAYINVT